MSDSPLREARSSSLRASSRLLRATTQRYHRRAGALAGPVRTLTSSVSSTRYFNVAPVARVGGDLAVLAGTHTGLTGHTGHTGRIDFLRENAPPLMRVTEVHPVTQSPERVTSYRVAPLQNTAVVAWIGTGTPRRIGLARLTP